MSHSAIRPGDLISWGGLSGVSRYSFWRTAAGAEVDLVVERGERLLAVPLSSLLGVCDSS